jgi:protein NrfD
MFHPGVFGTLLLETSAGGLYLISFMNRFEKVSRTFYRLHGTLFLILSGLALFFTGPTTYTGLLSENFHHVGNLSILSLTAGIVVLILYNIVVYFGSWKTQQPRSRQIVTLAAILHLLSLSCLILALLPEWSPSPKNLLVVFSFLGSAFLLGVVVLAMNMGHFYLTNPTLPIEPLMFLTKIMLGTMIFVTGVTVLETGYDLRTSPDFAQALKLESFEGLYVWGRLLLGIIGGLAISVLSLKTVKMHATQAATGLLYVALLFILFGQAFSGFLFLSNGILL